MSEPVLSDYLRLTRTSHQVTEQLFHQGVGFVDGRYGDHGHVIRDTDDEEAKNYLAAHIDKFHKGGKVDGQPD